MSLFQRNFLWKHEDVTNWLQAWICWLQLLLLCMWFLLHTPKLRRASTFKLCMTSATMGYTSQITTIWNSLESCQGHSLVSPAQTCLQYWGTGIAFIVGKLSTICSFDILVIVFIVYCARMSPLLQLKLFFSQEPSRLHYQRALLWDSS